MKFRTLTMTSALAAAAMLAIPAQAAVFTLGLAGNPANFGHGTTDFGGLHFDIYSLALTGLDNSNAITVVQGDTISSTITLSSAYTIPLSSVRTDILQYLTNPGFISGNTAVSGTFNFYNGAALVNSFNYTSTSSGLLSAFAAVFPPSNGAFTFTSLTNALTIDTLTGAGTINHSEFSYALVSPAAVPEPASWALLTGGFALVGVAARRRRPATLAA